ncbi:peptidoglycan-binding protein [Micromonospora profundi]|uniref:peptidoglycan-binding protein n=1 Tax=Micromonospora profundi TaxID=1420889 RepID=UPI00365B04BC
MIGSRARRGDRPDPVPGDTEVLVVEGDPALLAGPSNTLRRRQRWVLTTAILCAVMSVGGLVLSSWIKSPQQQLAESEAPEASFITATVEKRALESTLVTRGVVVAGTTIEVTPVAPDTKAQLVTDVRIKPGDEVKAGQVLLAVSARPLIVLPGKLPAYRDLKPGDRGADVRQLQAALRSLGFGPIGDSAGYFGAATRAAVGRMYAKLGYDTANTGGPGGRGDREALAAADKAVKSASEAVADIRRRIAAKIPVGPAEKPLAAQLADQKEALSEAERARSELRATTGTMLPLSEFVFVPSFPARVAAFTAKIGDVVEAPLIKLSTGRLAVEIKARPDQAELLRPGMAAVLNSETLGQEIPGEVSAVGAVETEAEPGTQEQGGQIAPGTPFQSVSVSTSKALPAQWADQEVRVTITEARTDVEVLVVPMSAVSAGADGKTTVSVLSSDSSVRRLEVAAGVTGNGFVEVDPVGGELAAGDRVIVGEKP